VLLILPDRDSPVLTRELIYTALTRARRRITLWARGRSLKTPSGAASNAPPVCVMRSGDSGCLVITRAIQFITSTGAAGTPLHLCATSYLPGASAVLFFYNHGYGRSG